MAGKDDKGSDDDAKPKTPAPGEQLKLLVEIVSCWNLLKGDLRSSDPYVKVKMAGKDIHETKHMLKTLNPVFTVKSNALFCLEIPAQELYDAGGLFFKVKDWDAVGGNDELGSVQVDAQRIYEASGERMEFELTPPKGKERKKAGFIAIRVRPATHTDREFLDSVKNEKKDFLGIKSAMKSVTKTSGGKGRPGLFGSNKKTENGIKKFRVRPEPDPERVEETTWMSKEEIQAEAQKESLKWIDVGTGDLGKIFLEIIGCDGLENKDGGLAKNKTDAFAALVYEDCMAKTDVIDDSLSPRWLPWMQRAFIFRMMHTSSQLMVGVFDSDQGVGNKHDMVGRVSVDLSNFHPSTEYVLQYNLYETAKLADRTPQGTITIRLRIEYEDERKAIMNNLKPIPDVYVNVKDQDDYRVVRKTIDGKHDTKKYDTDTLNSYVAELKSYKILVYYLQDSALNLLFWRGHFPLNVRVFGAAPKKEGEAVGFFDKFSHRVTIHLPLHSFNAFVAGILLAEHPSLAPSFFFFGIAWLLLSIMGYRRKCPDPWDRCTSFDQCVRILIFGGGNPETIKAHENEAAALAYQKAWEDRLKAAEELAAKKQEELLKEEEEYQKMMEEIGETTADTKLVDDSKRSGGFALLKPILYPLQQKLALVCQGVRFVRNVVIWDECFITFWIVAGSLALGTVCLFVPWVFLFRWTSRILAWGLLGPWMMLVDIYWYQKKPTEEEIKEREEQERLKKIESAKQAAALARSQREEAAKLKDMKAVLYGEYISKVPVLSMDRHRDRPLAASSATPCKPEAAEDTKTRSRGLRSVFRVGGQTINPDMIPKLKDE